MMYGTYGVESGEVDDWEGLRVHRGLKVLSGNRKLTPPPADLLPKVA